MRQALANLDEEATYISADDPAAARIVVHALFAGDALRVIQAAGARRAVSTNSLGTEEPRYVVLLIRSSLQCRRLIARGAGSSFGQTIDDPLRGHPDMTPRVYEAKAFVGATQAQVFDFLDDHQRLVSHMTRSSWSMGGGRMVLEADAGMGRRVGSRLRLIGRAFGVKLEVEEEITERDPPRRKSWRTIGDPRLLVIGHYELGFELDPAANGTLARVFIEYDLPAGVIARLAGRALAGMYAKWCVDRMIGDARGHFADVMHASTTAG